MATRSIFDGYGLQILTQPEIQENLEESFKSSFGDNIRLESTSVFGQLIKNLSLSVAELYELIELIAGSLDPSGATGDMLSRLVQLNGISRTAGSYTDAIVTLTATDATTVPAGTILSDSNDITWATDTDIIFTAAGDQDVGVTCLTLGPITLAAGTLTTIINPVYGLASVTNAADATEIGNDTETDTALRARRASVAERASSTSVSALYAALSDVDGVELVKIIANSGTETDANGISPQHVLCIVSGVSATNEQDVGEAIFEHIGAGIGTAGDIEILYEDAITEETYAINYSEPDDTTIYIDVDLVVTDADVYDDDLVIAAIEEYFLENYTIGSLIYFTRLYQPIMSIPGHYVTALYMGTTSDPSATSNIQLGTIQMATPSVRINPA